MLNKFIFLIIGFASPLLLWPIEFFLPFPYIIEELFKFLSLSWLSRAEFKNKTIQSKHGLILSIAFAVLFTLTESVLYLMNLSLLNQFDLFPKRILYTGLLHVTTTILILFGMKKRWYVQIFMLLISVIVHYIYNIEINNYL